MKSRPYTHEWYLKHKERILRKNKEWSARHPEVERRLGRKYYYRNLEEIRRKNREKYHILKDQGYGESQRIRKKLRISMKLTTMKGDKGERINLYLKHKEYFDARISQDSKWKQKKAPAAIMYISTNKTLRQVAVEFNIGSERVRQIVYEFLRKVERIYRVNAKVLDAQVVIEQKPLVYKLWEVHQAISSLEYGLQQLKALVARMDNDSVASLETVVPQQLPVIEDGGEQGYLRSDVKQYLKKEDYDKLVSWYGENHFQGGIVDGEYYFLKKRVDEYLRHAML